jgi:hypothetical protein
LILLKKALINSVIATAVYVVLSAVMSSDGISIAALKAAFWPNGASFGAIYFVITFLISRFRRAKRQPDQS